VGSDIHLASSEGIRIWGLGSLRDVDRRWRRGEAKGDDGEKGVMTKDNDDAKRKAKTETVSPNPNTQQKGNTRTRISSSELSEPSEDDDSVSNNGDSRNALSISPRRNSCTSSFFPLLPLLEPNPEHEGSASKPKSRGETSAGVSAPRFIEGSVASASRDGSSSIEARGEG